MLKVNHHLEFPVGFGYLPRSLVCLTQQVVGDVVRWIHFYGPVQIVKRLDGLIELKECLAEQDVGSGGIWLQQYRTIESLLGFGELSCAEVSIAETVVEVSV